MCNATVSRFKSTGLYTSTGGSKWRGQQDQSQMRGDGDCVVMLYCLVVGGGFGEERPNCSGSVLGYRAASTCHVTVS